jgi:hypothetical protein
MPDLWVDHVIYAVGDLELAAARFQDEFGLASVAGGRHPGWGTANRIVPLGHEYVELVTVADPDEAAASAFGRPVMEAVASGRRLVGWAVATDDLHGIARRLNLKVTSGSRTRPDGSTLSWQLAGVGRALATPGLPFFIQWDVPPQLHPGAAVVEHRGEPRGIRSIEITGDEQLLRTWLGDHDLPVRITEGPPALSAVAITTAAGEIVLR